MLADPNPAPIGLLTVHTGSLRKNPVCPSWVVSRRLAKSYIELVPTSEFGGTTDIRQAPRHAHVIGPVLLSSATKRHSLSFGELQVICEQSTFISIFSKIVLCSQLPLPRFMGQVEIGSGPTHCCRCRYTGYLHPDRNSFALHGRSRYSPG
jgi:hypothetical protein